MKSLKNLTIKDGNSLSEFLKIISEELTKEALDEIQDERQAQDDISDQLKDYKASESSDDTDEDVEEAEDDSEEDEESKKPKKDTTKLGSANPKPEKVDMPSRKDLAGAGLDDVIKSLNKIRSGKSLKDEKTKKELNDYITSLADAEKQSLFVFLSGLSQIMAGGVSGDDAPDPGKVGITVNATTRVDEPKSSKAKKAIPSKVATNTAAGEATPIVVGEVANKSGLHTRVRRLMKRN
jgi:hypothetical protein